MGPGKERNLKKKKNQFLFFFFFPFSLYYCYLFGVGGIYNAVPEFWLELMLAG